MSKKSFYFCFFVTLFLFCIPSVNALTNEDMINVCEGYNISAFNCIIMWEEMIPLIANSTFCKGDCPTNTIYINNTLNQTEFVPVPYQLPCNCTNKTFIVNQTIKQDCNKTFEFLSAKFAHEEKMLEIRQKAEKCESSDNMISKDQCDVKCSEEFVRGKEQSCSANNYSPLPSQEKDFLEKYWWALLALVAGAAYWYKKNGSSFPSHHNMGRELVPLQYPEEPKFVSTGSSPRRLKEKDDDPSPSSFQPSE